ncbi:MAG: hypothetical protein P1T08_15980 [Acidimicrobiia bacterium]|nr:hypothetical protein [Acidimicrobiia bacterium]
MANSTEPADLRSRWAELDTKARVLAIVQAVVHLTLAFVAFRSLATRDTAAVRGPKLLWKSVIPASISTVRSGHVWIFPLGPILYMTLGRRRNPAPNYP